LSDWPERAERQLGRIRKAGQWRTPRDIDPGDATAPVAFASNDYLGLTRHPAVIAAAQEALARYGTGSGSARLVVGSRPIHAELEAALADWKGTEGAVLFPTGFAANLGALATFGAADTLILSDELNHASIIDGCRLAQAEVEIYRHGDVDHVEKLLIQAAGRPAIVVTDSVFSMDGDTAPVADLAELAGRFGALLVLDEAHAVLGPEPDLAGVDALRIGTLSKTLASLGGFVAGSTAFCDLLINRARPYIFTTASTPADTAAAHAALTIYRADEGQALRARLRDHIARVRPGHPSPIIPIVLGDEQRAVAASAHLLAQGLLVPAIRPPTVAPGTSRLRVALSAAHTDGQITRLIAALATLDQT
jgi:8-amino-7-oxononanoate synthase